MPGKFVGLSIVVYLLLLQSKFQVALRNLCVLSMAMVEMYFISKEW